MAGLVGELEKKDADLDRILMLAERRPEGIAELLEGLSDPTARIRYGCEKVLRRLSERAPELLYPHLDELAALLESEKNVLKWGAIQILANLVAVDRDRRFDRIFDRYFAAIKGPMMITAANVVAAAARIARSRPDLADRIAREILKVEAAGYRNRGELSPECNRVVCGHAVVTLDSIFELIEAQEVREGVTGFARRQLASSRPQVRKNAETFLQHHGLSGERRP